MEHLDQFTSAAIEALVFTEDEAFQDDPSAMSNDLHERLQADCHSFWARCWFYVKATDMSPAQAGHDFIMSRNNHGCGFWDGDWDHTPYAELLDGLAKKYGELECYRGDDGEVHA